MKLLGRFLLAIVVAIAVYCAWGPGTRLRAFVFDFADPIRFRGDLENAYRHGTHILNLAREQNGLGQDVLPTWWQTYRAYLDFYDRVLADWPRPNYHLDYPPMRLFVMTTWARAVTVVGQRTIPGELPACGSLLMLNTIVVAISSLGAALLVHHWLRRGMRLAPSPVGGAGRREEATNDRAETTNRQPIAGELPSHAYPLPPGQRGWGRDVWHGVVALLAGLLLWFDFAVLVDAHAWPQWDVWVLPFFFYALLAASHRKWLTAGVIFAVGGMFKGQLLVVAPLLIGWPIFGRQWRGVGRLFVGLLVGIALIESMWVIVTPLAGVLCVLCLGLIVAARGYWPRVLRGRHAPLLGLAAICVLVSAYVGGASFGWITQGFVYGAERNNDTLAGVGANNLGQLLAQRFGWNSTGDVVYRWRTWTPGLGDDPLSPPLRHRFDAITLGMLMKSAYALGTIGCAIALARHDRRNDIRALAAMVAPWMLFYLLMPQLSSRYFVWSAAASCMLVALGVGPMLLHLIISASAALTITHVLILYSRGRGSEAWWPELTIFLRGLHPGTAWLTLMLTAVVTYLAWTGSGRTRALRVEKGEGKTAPMHTDVHR